MIITDWINNSTKQLASAGISTAKLDVELILAEAIKKQRTWLHAHGQEELSPAHEKLASSMLELRRERVPLAYILGYKEFYGRKFSVTADTLIPRPETEALVDIILELEDIDSLIDVGCGSGAIGLSAKLQRPELQVTLADVSLPALAIATNNAQYLEVKVDFIESNLLASPALANQKFSMIVANLPYVNETWEVSPELKYEPALALYADQNGLKLIYQLLEQAPAHLLKAGYLLLEADPDQHPSIIERAKNFSFKHRKTTGYGLLLQLGS